MKKYIAEVRTTWPNPDDRLLFAAGMEWNKSSSLPEQILPVRHALETWQERYQPACAATWVMDAALQTITLAAARKRKRPSEWIYFPAELEYPKFSPRFSEAAWSGTEREPWCQFRERMHKQFNQQLNKYRSLMRLITPITPSQAQQRAALWLARYMCGDTWERIWKDDASEDVAKSRVRNPAIILADRIGLDPPERAPGRRPGSRNRRKRGLLVETAPKSDPDSYLFWLN